MGHWTKAFYCSWLQWIYKLTLDAKTKQKKLVNKFAIFGFINNADLSNKLVALATTAELKAELDKITKLQAYWCKLVSRQKWFWKWWNSNSLNVLANVEIFLKNW